MLISFDEIVRQHGRPSGVFHIGAHLLEERGDYLRHGLDNTVWVEANPRVCEVARGAVGPRERLYNFAAHDTSGATVDFHLTNNGMSSSLLELDRHATHHPDVVVTETIAARTMRMDDLVRSEGIDLAGHDFLNLDIQGAELAALVGFGELLGAFRMIYTEVNSAHLYRGCALIGDIDLYLSGFGFAREMTQMTQWEWGDALYRRAA